VIPGERLLWADGNTLRARAAQLTVDSYGIIDECHAVLVADLHTQTTDRALAFVKGNHNLYPIFELSNDPAHSPHGGAGFGLSHT